MHSDGHVLSVHETSGNTYLLHALLEDFDSFGTAVANLPDLDGE